MTGSDHGAAAIPVIVCAKNEARSLGGTLTALAMARDYAEARSTHRFTLRVVLDDTTDGSAAVVARHSGVELRRSRGGKVEAQRAGVRRPSEEPAPPFVIFCDADVRPSIEALHALASLLSSRPDVQVATCPLRPLRPRRTTPLACALHTYNLRRGFSSQRTWFNGKLFAIRRWDVPDRAALAPRIAALPRDAFYDFDAGLVVDDVFLSRSIVRAHGAHAIAEASAGRVDFRAPETLRGMNRYYRRMRREIERLDMLFPETADVHRQVGRREADLLPGAPLREKMHHAVFSLALSACRVAYVAERAWVRRVRRRARESWPAIEETKAW